MRKDIEWLKWNVAEATEFVSDKLGNEIRVIQIGQLGQIIKELDEEAITFARAFNKVSEKYPMRPVQIAKVLDNFIANKYIERGSSDEDDIWYEGYEEGRDEMLTGQKILIDPSQLFNSKNDVRKYMRIDIRDEEYEVLADKYGGNAVDHIVDATSIYFGIDEMPNKMELELAEYEPEKPVLPGYVVEWIEEVKCNKYSISYLLNYEKVKEKKPKAFTYMFGSGSDDNLEKVACAWILDNWVVEENKYYVLSTEGRTMLARKMDGKTITEADAFAVDDLIGSERREHQLTEQEIKDYDPRYFAFAIPVDEVE